MVAAATTGVEMAAGMLSPDGRCKTFDAAANGYVRGEGCGVLVLKRLSEAERDGDRILGVVLGSAVNQDGASAGLTAPNGPAQERVIREALARAGIAASDVDYLEAHGTGTELGDPIEVQAAAAAYGEGREAERPLLIGSVKTNIGHLEAAAGVAGAIKALLAMRHGVIPRHLHFERPNPRLDWEALPVRVTAETAGWPAPPDRPPRDRPPRAGVSSFGFSGTNAHVILEGRPRRDEAPGTVVSVPIPGIGDAAAPEERRFRLLPLSARSRPALGELAGRYLDWMENGSGPPSWDRLSDAAWTAGVGRHHFRARAGVVFAGAHREDWAAALRDQLAALAAGPAEEPDAAPEAGKVGFLFTGQGSQWQGMGRGLYEREPVAREVFERAEAVCQELRDRSLLSVMFAEDGAGGELDATEWTQPALYALAGALVALWRSVGIFPDAVLGHSVGEIAAAQAAGAFGFEAGMRFVLQRGSLMGSLPQHGEGAGGMLAVFAPAAEVASQLKEANTGACPAALALAADNGAHQVVSGSSPLLAAFGQRMEKAGHRTRRLRTSHAFHSALMDPVLDELEELASGLGTAPFQIPLVSNLTGDVLGPEEAPDAAYWRGQARAPVRFAAGVSTLSAAGVRILIEIGPRPVLGPLAILVWPAAEAAGQEPALVASQQGKSGAGDAEFCQAVARAYEAGLPLSFTGLYAGERRRRVSVPSYPFQRRRHWARQLGRALSPPGHPFLGAARELPRGGTSFEIAASDLAWMADHRVFGSVVAPGMLYAAQALAAARLAGGSRARDVAVEGLRIERPFVLPEREPGEGSALQFVMEARNGSSAGFEVFGRRANERAWTRHAAGRVGGKERPEFERLTAAALAERKAALLPVSAPDLYAWFGSLGLDYGPLFQGITRLWVGAGEALARVARPTVFGAEAGEVHPALMDACFQLILSFGYGRDEREETIWLPVGCDLLWLAAELPAELTCHATIREVPGAAGPAGAETRTVDVTVFGPDGEPVGRAGGFTLRRATRSALLAASAGISDLLYEVEWREAPAAALQAPPDSGSGPGLWVVWPRSVRSGGAGLARELEARGETVLAPAGETGKPGTDGSAFDPHRRESWRAVLEGLPESPPLRGVVHCAGLGGPGADASPADLRAVVERGTRSALALTQALQEVGATPPAGISFMTAGAQVLAEDKAGEPAGAPLWGFGRSAGRELGDVPVRLFDLDPGGEASFEQVAEELLLPDGETEVAFRDGNRLSPRLVRSAARPHSDPGREPVRGDRTYLVTGGMGGLGIRMAGWLGEQGAGAVVLNGRRPPDERALAAVRDLRQGGLAVRIEIADVADAAAVSRMVDEIGASGLPPLGGVIHSVGGLSDRSLANQDWENFERLLWPKLLGAWNLHRATLDLPLDQFVLFSSFTAVLGSAGQTNYTAANAFLDQFARWRRARGLPGQAIAWGPWSRVGGAEAERERIAASLEAAGVGWLTPERGLTALSRVFRDDPPGVMVASVDWQTAGRAAAPGSSLLRELAAAGVESAASGDLVRRVREAPAGDREEMLVRFLQEQVRSALGLADSPPPEVGFFDLGVDSLMAVELRNRVSRALAGSVRLPNTLVFDHPDIARLARHLAGQLGSGPEAQVRPPVRPLRVADERVAIVGMAGRFPGGDDLAAFWGRLAAGADLVAEGRPDDLLLDDDGGEGPLWGAYVADLDRFDAGLFRIAPAEAELMDPQHRLLLEAGWGAIEDAGLDPESLRGSRTGVFAGIMNRDYERFAPAAASDPASSLYSVTGGAFSAAIGRVSFALGFEGPAMAVDTACSSSLVAIHQGVSALLSGDADLALAGGVNAILAAGPTRVGITAGMLSPDGRCRTFDARANGYVRGEGCGMLVLKRLADAEREGDRILAVILGSAVNQDGASAGFTAPRGPAQEQVLREAVGRAGIAASSVDYLEAHGTGTELGDPIEVQAAAAVYGEGRGAERPLLIGSVKTNIGHLESAAGIAGVIKTVLAMQRGVIPKHLHFETPNPRLDWDRLPVRVTADATPWPTGSGGPPRAGVSSFGLTGTNAHLILEGYGPSGTQSGETVPVPAAVEKGAETGRRRLRFLPLSARTPEALSELAGRYRKWLDERPEASWEELSDAAFTAGAGRAHFAARAGLPFSDGVDLGAGLLALAEGRGSAGSVSRRGPGKVGFLFTGQGSHFVGMGRDLYEREPSAREIFDRAEEVIRDERGVSLLDVTFGRDAATGSLEATEWAQPALFTLAGALVALWKNVEVTPDAVLGHSVGEIAAAHAAGAFGFEEGLRFAARRGTLMGALPVEGADAAGMLAVFAPGDDVASLMEEVNGDADGGLLELAADNGSHWVVSGPGALLGKLGKRLDKARIRSERLGVRLGFHSRQMDPVLEPLEAAASALDPAPPAARFVSGLTGRVAGLGDLGDPSYWSRQARLPVRFAAGAKTLSELECDVLIEIGPRAVLGPLAAVAWPDREAPAGPILASSQAGPRKTGDSAFLAAVSRTYEAGVAVSFRGLYAGERRRRVSVPGYPFQRERYWVRGRRVESGVAGDPLLGVRRELPGGEISFQLDTRQLSWLADHRVFGRPVAPGAFYAAQALAAVRASSSSGEAHEVRDLEIERALLLPEEAFTSGRPDDARILQFVLGKREGGSSRRFEIFSRVGSGPWVRHASGRVGVARSLEVGSSVPAAPAVGENRLSPTPPADLYRWFASRGIGYGPAFRGIAEFRVGAGEALGLVRLPDGLGGGARQPALLDACFQVLGGLWYGEDDPEGAVWLPLGLGSLRLAAELPEELLCRAVPVATPDPEDGAAGTRSADLTLYAPDGRPVGQVRGVTLRRASRGALLAAASGPEELLYEVTWAASPLATAEAGSAAFLADPRTAIRDLGNFGTRLKAEGLDPGRLHSFAGELEALARSYALAALDRLGFERRAGEVVAGETLRRELRVVEQHGGLLLRLLDLVGDSGVLAPAGDRGEWLVVLGSGDAPPEPLGDPDLLAERLLVRHPEAAVEGKLLTRCGRALPDVLRGRDEGLDLLFAGDPDAGSLYREAPAFRTLHGAVADTLRALVADLPSGRPLRVLEVGAGTGATTAAVRPLLPAARTEYVFTDISTGFLTAAEERLRDFAGMQYRLLDIERDPGRQGFDSHRYDLVLAANVLHATRDLAESLANCRRLLAPAGALVLLEGVERRGLLDLTFGLLPGWWRFDDAYRADHPLVDAPVWRRALEDTGYGDVGVWGGGDHSTASGEPAPGSGAQVFVARAPHEIRPDPGLWVVFPGEDGEGVGQALAAALEDQGQTVVRPKGSATDAERRQWWRGVFSELPSLPALRGVVHLGALTAAGELPATGPPAEAEAAALSALALCQGLYDAGAAPESGLWFVTRGGQVFEGDAAEGLAGSVLWGLARTAAHEFSDFRVRLVDLDPQGADLGALRQELLFPDRETEVVWRSGERRAARLARLRGGSRTAGPDPPIRGDRTVLVTGGLGGVGLEVARWLVDHGAGGIVLNGRRAPEAEVRARLEVLGSSGTPIRLAVADVTDREAVDTMLAEVRDSGLPPLGGVIHSVGEIADATLPNQDRESFERVLRPKLWGAWHLHQATSDAGLDLFLLFSSAAGVLGNSGQANHAAANAFLDQLANWRRAGGLPGQAVAWGPWLEVGEAAAAQERVEERLAALGVGWMTAEEGLAVLELLVGRRVGTAMAARMDWAAAAGDGSRPLLEEFRPSLAERGVAALPEDLPGRLSGLPGAERLAALVRFLGEQLQSVLRLSVPASPEVGFFELGVDSLTAVEFRNRVQRALGPEVPVPNTLVFDYPDIDRVARYLAGRLGDSVGDAVEVSSVATRPSSARGGEDPIAIVGMAARFPGGPNLPAFWQQLAAGAHLVTRGRPDDLMVQVAGRDASPWGAYVPHLDRFDAAFFRIAPVEAELMDPQQRLLLETSWEALEDAGMDPGGLQGSRTGVYAGIMSRDYERFLALPESDPARSVYFLTGSGFSGTIGRVAFTLGLRGPAIAVDTACSSSLVAIHQAVAGLSRGDADLALAGGVNAILASDTTGLELAAGMLSPDGRCRTFDAAANGYVRGEGCGVVVLKRLSEAERDGDRILGVILGSAVNQDGASAGFTVPNGPAQEDVIREALSRAGVPGSDVDYLEAHGTGTELGDPIEVQAAAAVYGEGRDRGRPLLLGSVKTNIGHLESAAGVAGVIKVLLAMRHGVVPPHLHFETPNPRIDWAELPVRVTPEATPWPAIPGRRMRAGVSSFGFSGTNAHLVLESYGETRETPGASVAVPVAGMEEVPAETSERRVRVLPLSGRSGAAAAALAGRYMEWLDEADRDFEGLSDGAWTAGVGRSHFGRRAGVVFSGGEELRAELSALASGEVREDAPDGRRGKVGFLFTGQGSQWPGMGRDLYEREPVFREVLDRAEAVIREERGESLLSVMFGGEGRDLEATEWTQPALVAVQGALLALWRSVGVEPDAVLGHSVGEISAAHAAGVFGFEEGLRFASRRGALMGSLPRRGRGSGGMAAVFAPVSVVMLLVSELNAGARVPLDLAAENGTHQVVSGPPGLLGKLFRRLRGSGVRVERLSVSHAFHSSLMDPVLGGLGAAASSLAGHAPSVPLITGVTGRVAGPDELEGAYWRRQARSPVRFAPGVRTLAGLGSRVLIELGPRAVLGPLAALAWPVGEESEEQPVLVSSQGGPGLGGDRAFAKAVSGAYEAGVVVSFAGLFAGERRRRISIPAYPFQRERHWMRDPARSAVRLAGASGSGLPGTRRNLPRGEISFEISTGDLPWFPDHRIFGRPVAPAALYAAQAFEAARSFRSAGGAWQLTDVRLERPLALPTSAADAAAEAGCTIQLLLGSREAGAARPFEIFSRPDDSDDWTLHAAGRAAPIEAGDWAEPVAPLSAARKGLKRTEKGSWYAGLSASGLDCGPAFRGIEELWTGPGRAVGEVRLSEDLRASGSPIHPPFLDACFQVALGLGHEVPTETPGVWIPVGWDHLRIAPELPERLVVHARTRETGPDEDAGVPDTLRVDLDLAGPDGGRCGELRGGVMRRVGRSALLSGAAGIQDLLYEVRWRPQEDGDAIGSADFLPDPAAAISGMEDYGDALRAERSDPERADALERGLESLSRRYAVAAFEALGFERRAAGSWDAESLRRKLGVVEQHRGLFGRLLAILEAAGVVVPGDGSAGWQRAPRPPRALPDPEEMAASLLSRFPEGWVEIALLRRCGAALSEVLRGRAEGLELLFSGEPDASDLYWKAPLYRAVNRMFGQAVRALTSGLPDGRRLRVLEVGAGTGGTTNALLPVLPEGRTDYLYTDVSASFLETAQERFPGTSGMRYRALDIERDPVEQGFAPHRYDVVVAANVLHATRDLSESLGHCRRLLAPSGMAILLEPAGRRGWLDLTFGMLSGWWRFDDAYRADAPLASPSGWRRALSDAGFEAAEVASGARLPAGGEETEARPGFQIVMGRGPAELRPDPGLFVVWPGVDGDGMATALGRELEGLGQTVVMPAGGAKEAERREWWRSVFAGLPPAPAFRGVVHLDALSVPGGDPSGSALPEGAERVALSALGLAQGLHDGGTAPGSGLWLVTRGGQVFPGDAPGGLAGAPLWGLGRVASREIEDFAVRMVDLDPGEAFPAGVLARELVFPDGESEVARRHGRRRVARLQRLPATGLPETGGWRFARDPAGALERPRIEPAPLATGTSDVRLAVEAAGLNFRDVMVGMGLVQAGEPLGGEVCGRVLETGPGVTGFAPGDRVVGFAEGTFGPEVVTPASVLAPAPPGLPLGALAGAPVAFVTAALALEGADLAKGDAVLVHAGTGGVGHAALRLAQAAGLRVYATASAPKQEYLRSLGVAEAFDSRSTAFAERLLGATGGVGVRLVLNSLTGDGFVKAGLRCLGERGWFVEIGKRGVWRPERVAALRPDVRYRVLAVDRVVAEEPERAGAVLRQVMQRVGSGELLPPPHTRWPLASLGAAMDHLREARHIGKLVLAPSALASGGLRADRSYLVTGGLGGIGIEVAAWLHEQGAGGIVLNGRRAPDRRPAEAIERLRARGAEVRVIVADVSRKRAVERMLSGIDASDLPALGGVIHSAGALADAALANQDRDSFERVLRPKVFGAWNLHRATLDRELELFVLFSSFAGVVGNPGQANHAAANAFLDQLARWRRTEGLPGQAIAWGAWSRIGEAEEQRERIEDRMTAVGAGWMTPEQGLAALTRLVREDVGSGGVARMDWRAPGGRGRPLFEDLAPDAAPEERSPRRGDFPSRLREAPATERVGLLMDFLGEEVRSLLRLSSPPASQAVFFDLGMDSLTAVELRNRVSRALAGVQSVSGTVVLDHPSISRLARHLAAVWEPGPESGPPSADDQPEDLVRAEYERLRELDEEELLAEGDALLANSGRNRR